MDLTRDTRWKILEHDGWQILVTVEENEDDDRWSVSITLGALEMDVTIRFTAATEKTARAIFDATNEPDRVYEGLRGQFEALTGAAPSEPQP